MRVPMASVGDRAESQMSERLEYSFQPVKISSRPVEIRNHGCSDPYKYQFLKLLLKYSVSDERRMLGTCVTWLPLIGLGEGPLFALTRD